MNQLGKFAIGIICTLKRSQGEREMAQAVNFETGSHCTALAGLELTEIHLSAENEGVFHHNQSVAKVLHTQA